MKQFVLSLLILLLGTVGPAPAFDLTVLHVNDTHSYLAGTSEKVAIAGETTQATLGGWACLASAVEQVRRERPHVALLHAGDAVQGGLYFLRYGGRPEMELLDRLGFDAFVLGNHEFDKGAAFLADMLHFTHVPVLGANVTADGAPALAARLRPYTVLDYGGERVGVIGLTTPDTRFTSSPGPGVRFADVAETARRYVRELEAMGIDRIILLTHIGFAADQALAASVPGVDVIVGGHSHTLLGRTPPCDFGVAGLEAAADYPVEVRGADGAPVYVVTAWKWSRVLGRLDVSFDDAGRVASVRPAPLLLVDADTLARKTETGYAPLPLAETAKAKDWLRAHPPAFPAVRDTAVAACLAPFTTGLETLRREVVGRAAADLTHIRVPGTTPSGVVLPHGSLLAPLVAQSMLDRLARTGEPADLALLNGGGVRESIPAGPITVGMAYTVLPFANTLFLLDLTGAQLRAALEYGVTRGGGAFPYLAGARYDADMTRPEGVRITSVEVRRGTAWHPLEPARTYRVVTNAFLAKGGDGYAVLASGAPRADTGFGDAQAFIEFVRRARTLAPPVATGVTYLPGK